MVCAHKALDGANYRLACILSGGVQTIGAGVIAIIRFEAAKDAMTGEKIVDLEKIAGVSVALEPIPIENTKALITIR